VKIVLDTNVLVSGLLSAFGTSAQIVKMASSGVLEIYHDARVLTEYREVLRRPEFRLDATHVDALLEQIEAYGHGVATKPLEKKLPDPKDEPFLEVTLAANAECLVTWNIKDVPAHSRQGVKVVKPSEFLQKHWPGHAP
jgi:uncharacterized protein